MAKKVTKKEVEEIVSEVDQASEQETAVEEANEGKQFYRGVLITGAIEDIIHHGHPYKKFSIETGESLMLSPAEFEVDVTTQ